MTHYFLIMLAAGIGIPVLAAINAGLGVHLGSPVAAGIIAFAVALGVAIVVYFVLGSKGFSRITTTPPHLFIAGFFVAFYLLSITMIGPIIGIGAAVFMVLMGQLFSAAIIDHFGLFGARLVPLSPTRILGLMMMAGGIWLTQIVK